MRKKMRAYTHWTADTEIAFLLALRLTGSAKKAALEIGRSFVGAYKRRERLPDFAERWEREIDRWRERNAADYRADHAGDSAVTGVQTHFDGWTPLRQRAFLRALTETGKVAEACRRVGLSEGGAYKARRMYPAFSDAWDRAELHADADLEQVAVERAIDGIEEPVFHAGRQVAVRRRYSDPLMGRLLGMRERKARDAAKLAAKDLVTRPPRATKAETDAVLLKRLAALDARDARLKAEAIAAMWAAWCATWGWFGRGGVRLPDAPKQEVLPPLPDDDEGAKLRVI